MLLIYLLEDHPVFGARVRELRKRSVERGDEICTSALGLGELLAGVHRFKTVEDVGRVRVTMSRGGIKILPFDTTAADTFGRIRAKHRTSAADSIHLACAATAGVDLFLTADKEVLKLHIPGIKFIAGLDTNLL